jgi:putative oxidoreductase
MAESTYPTGRAEPRLIYPALGGVYAALDAYAHLILRLAAGLIFVPHGLWKLGFLGGPGLGGVAGFLGGAGYWPGWFWAPFLTGLEIVGGILLAIGLFTRPVAALFFIQMAVIVYHHSGNGFLFTNQGGGYEYPLMWLAVIFYFLVRGGGPMSVDRSLGREV